MTLRLPAEMIGEMIAHSYEDLPNECCGIITSEDGVATKLHRIRNAEASHFRYKMDQDDVFRGLKDVDLDDSRILVTRTKKIQKKWGARRHVFISSNLLVDQLKQVVDQIGIGRDDIRPFSKCLHCNLPIDRIDKNEVYGLVPDYIWETHDAFNRCSRCQRIYWSGSHAERSMAMIESIFNAE